MLASSSTEYPSPFKARVVHFSIAGSFLTLNRTLYISSKLIEECEEDDDALAYYLSNQISHHILGHSPEKYFTMMYKRLLPSLGIYNEYVNYKETAKLLGYLRNNRHTFTKYSEKRADVLA